MPPPAKRAKKVLQLSEKIKILDRLKTGESASSIGRSFNINESTVRSIKKNEAAIRGSVTASAPASAKTVCQVRNKSLEETESALNIWIEDMNQKQVPLSSGLIRAKAKRIFDVIKDPESSFNFQASKGWFENFKHRFSLHNVKLTGEKASADHDSAKKFQREFSEIIEAGGYVPEQVFNADETGLFWKKMPNRTFLSKKECSAPGFKVAKDRISLLLCANASGDFKVKPMLIYRSLNPRCLKNKNKNELPVFWRANSKAWVTSALFLEWFNLCFIPGVKKYLSSKNLDFKVLLIIDNAPGHPVCISEVHPNVQVVFLPPNTTSLIQPLDQGVIAALKVYYTRRCMKRILETIELKTEATVIQGWKNFSIADCIQEINASYLELSEDCINASWRNLWPEVVRKEKKNSPLSEEITAILDLAHQIGGEGFSDMKEDDLSELIKSHDIGLTEEELIEIIENKNVETDSEDEKQNQKNEDKKFYSETVGEIIKLKQQIIDKVENDPSIERALKFKREIEDATLPYIEIYKKQISSAKQSKITNYFCSHNS